MSNEIKQGDTVRVSKDAPRMYVSGHCSFFYGVESVVEEIEDGNAIIRRDDGSVNKALAIPCKYLVKVDAEAKEAKRIFYGDYAKRASESLEKLKRKTHPEWYSSTEPTEQTETEKKPYVGSIKIPVEVNLTDSYWDVYTADLAKEIVLKTVNSASDRRPSAIAEYATDVAKAVVEGLKRK